jgi:predicted dehydrogenase
MFLAQASAFVNTICGASDPRLATAEDGIKALAVCDAAQLASERRREEAVEYPFDKAQDRP